LRQRLEHGFPIQRAQNLVIEIGNIVNLGTEFDVPNSRVALVATAKIPALVLYRASILFSSCPGSDAIAGPI
jgi:hypothetical protein